MARLAAAVAVLLLAVAVAVACADKPPKLTAEALADIPDMVASYQPKDDHFEAALAASFNRAYSDVKPVLILVPPNEDGVKAAMHWAHKWKQAVTVRASGSSPAGFFVRQNAVMIDISRLNSVTVAADNSTFTIGGAASVNALSLELVKANKALPLPAAGTVSMGGYLLGGGIGLGVRQMGAAADYVTAMRMVTTDGSRVIDVRPDNNATSDLFYALLGAGGANFGVVTEFTLRTTVPNSAGVWYLAAVPSGADVGKIVGAAAQAPEAVHMILEASAGRTAIMAWYSGATVAEANAYFGNATLFGTSFTHSQAVECQYTKAVNNWQGTASVLHELVTTTTAYSRQYRNSGAYDAWNAVAGVAAEHDAPAVTFAWMNLIGSAKLAASKTTSSFAGSSIALTFGVLSESLNGTKGLHTATKWVDKARSAVGDLLGDGHYVEFPDPELPAHATFAYYSGKFADAHMRVKHQYDEDYLFGYPGSVPPCEGCADDLYGYVPPPTKEAANYASLYAIITLAVLSTVYLLYIVYRKDKPANATHKPLLESDV